MYSNSNKDNMQDLQDSMVKGTVRVVAVNGEKAWVQSETQSTCGGCQAAKSCGTKAIVGYLGKKSAPLEMHNTFKGAVGDRLEVGIKNTTILKVSALTFLLPLASLVVGAIIGDSLGEGDILPTFFGILGLAAGGYIARTLYLSSHYALSVAPVFLKKLEPVKRETVGQVQFDLKC